PSTEAATIGTAAKLKALNPNIKVLLYWNSVMNYESLFESNAEFGAHPEWVHSIWTVGSGTEYEIYDLENIDCQDWWVNSVVDIIERGDLDGVFFDAGPKAEVSGLSEALSTAKGRVRERIGDDKIIIYNGYRVANENTIQAGPDFIENASGVFIEFFLHSPLDTKEEAVLLFDHLIDAYEDGKMIVPRGTPSSVLPGTEDPFLFTFASFLLFYGPNSYYLYNEAYDKTKGMFDYYPEYYDKATGQSLGSPQREGWVYTRTFENASVRVDLLNKTSSINWIENPVHEPREEHAISIKVTNDVTKDSIPLATLAINGENYTTNYVGEIEFYLSAGEYAFTLSKTGYDTLFDTLNIIKDTAISLQLTALPEYRLSVKVRDDSTNVALSDVLLSIDDQDYYTNDVGEFSITLDEDVYDIMLSLAAYHSLSKSVDLIKDTLVVFQMDRLKYNLGFMITDVESGEHIPTASVAINDSVYITDAQGSLSLDMDYGDYAYTLIKAGYESINQSIALSKDTLIALEMDKQKYELVFQVKEAGSNENLQGASIAIIDTVYDTDFQGQVSLNLDYGDYAYTISKDAYEQKEGSIFLSMDTDTTILLTALISGKESLVSEKLHVHPNPFDNILTIALPNNSIFKYEVLSLTGELILSGTLRADSNIVNVSTLSSGVYIIKASNNQTSFSKKIIK
ncbi:MAG: putative glycoside hydrolase, partial [Bacteroides sp.]|nr:putative glycoside hydrolase [Bacteroides sp.]